MWRVNITDYRLVSLTNGELPGHNRTGTNILVNRPVNNTEYICVSQTNDGDVVVTQLTLLLPVSSIYIRTSVRTYFTVLKITVGQSFIQICRNIITDYV